MHQTGANPKTASPLHAPPTSGQGPGVVGTEKKPVQIIRKQSGHEVPTPRGRRRLQTALPALTLPSGSILRAFSSSATKAPSQNSRREGGRRTGRMLGVREDRGMRVS